MSRRRSARPSCDRPCAGLCRAEGFAAAHRANRAWLLARARSLLGDPGAAEDAVQETFLRAWAVRPRLAPEPDDAAEPAATADGAVDTALQRMVLLGALSQVSPEHRGVVLLAVVRDRPYADVAAALDIPVGTVKSRVHHALRGMRRSLDHDRTVLAA